MVFIWRNYYVTYSLLLTLFQKNLRSKSGNDIERNLNCITSKNTFSFYLVLQHRYINLQKVFISIPQSHWCVTVNTSPVNRKDNYGFISMHPVRLSLESCATVTAFQLRLFDNRLGNNSKKCNREAIIINYYSMQMLRGFEAILWLHIKLSKHHLNIPSYWK